MWPNVEISRGGVCVDERDGGPVFQHLFLLRRSNRINKCQHKDQYRQLLPNNVHTRCKLPSARGRESRSLKIPSSLPLVD